jgi:hypothetical protein
MNIWSNLIDDDSFANSPKISFQRYGVQVHYIRFDYVHLFCCSTTTITAAADDASPIECYLLTVARKHNLLFFALLHFHIYIYYQHLNITSGSEQKKFHSHNKKRKIIFVLPHELKIIIMQYKIQGNLYIFIY